jgi:4-diphosphocytidyl-2-C-methyl-D-erythritol kinase
VTSSDDQVVVLRAPAKINLGLRITGRRDNGYHELQSLFTPINLYDEITLGPGIDDQNTVTFTTENGAPLEFPNDSVSLALKILRDYTKELPPLEVKIKKRIPVGSGLGGGSSDAGTVLQFLAHRFSDIEDSDLRELAFKIGSDVPFFLYRKSALVWGIGDELKNVKVEPFGLVVAVPPFSISTKTAYGWFDKDCELTRPATDATTNRSNEAQALGFRRLDAHSQIITLQEIAEDLKNDLEKSVESRHPEIGILKKALRQWGALGSLMSGSGSSVYGIYKSLTEATEASVKLQQHFPSNYAFFVCETLT